MGMRGQQCQRFHFVWNMKKKIKENFPTRGKADLLKRILAIIDKHWEDQIDQPYMGQHYI